MNILAIDTANAFCSVALLTGNGQIFQKKNAIESKQAEHLFPLITSLFEETGYNYASLNALAVSIGPGSFTGIRIGMAAIRGIALATNLPVIGVTTLEATAWLASQEPIYSDNHPILAALDARRKQLYLQPFSSNLVPLGEATLSGYDEVPPYSLNTPFFLAGSGQEYLAHTLTQHHILFTQSDTILQPDATSIAHVAVRLFPTYDFSSTPHPFYVRKPDAKPQSAKLILK